MTAREYVLASRIQSPYPRSVSTDIETARPLPLATTSTRGRHLLLELWGCDSDCIGDVGRVERALLEATRALGASVLSSHLHRFAPQGVSGVVLIAAVTIDALARRGRTAGT